MTLEMVLALVVGALVGYYVVKHYVTTGKLV